jgi:GWxTD domain-containing protein
MAIVGFGKVTAWVLHAVLMGLCISMPVPAQSHPSQEQTTDQTSSSMPRVYHRWLDEDVRWIISPDERAAFLRLSKNEERDRFVEQFWIRRDPTPGTQTNKFKEEHYRRIAYANVHFPWQAVPGWKTDRGRIYILLGPPDVIKVEAARDSGDSLKPTESWHYHSTTGSGKDFKFFDVCDCGDYHLETSAKDLNGP